MSSKFTEVVQDPTRLNPPKILDPIITTLTNYYQVPKCLPPLDADNLEKGKASDHKMVVMESISAVSNKPARTKRTIVYRPFNEQKLQEMRKWIEEEDWSQVSQEKFAHGKAKVLQSILLQKYHNFFPLKKRVVSSDDKPFFRKISHVKKEKM